MVRLIRINGKSGFVAMPCRDNKISSATLRHSLTYITTLRIIIGLLQVINFDMPSTIDEYIHQVGRAGKLNKSGFAISFINNVNRDIFLRLFELCKVSNIKLPAELVNSPYIRQQQEQRVKKVGKRRNDIVKTENLMDLIKEHRKKKRR